MLLYEENILNDKQSTKFMNDTKICSTHLKDGKYFKLFLIASICNNTDNIFKYQLVVITDTDTLLTLTLDEMHRIYV